MEHNNKTFSLTTKEDYIFYLNEIISDLIQKRDRLETYCNEINLVLKNNPDSKFIQSELYEPTSDKICRLFQYIANIIGDDTKTAVSYKKYRRLLYKNRISLTLNIPPLSEEENKILNSFNQLRNWSLHIPESLLLQKKSFLTIDDNFIFNNKSSIPLPIYDYFDIKYLEKLEEEAIQILNLSSVMLEKMKIDYSILTDSTLELIYERNQVKPYLFMEIVENSWNDQTNKRK